MSQYFSDTLKKLRNKKGLSQLELADRLFVTRSTVSRWESGNRLPDAVMITRLAEVLGVDGSILFDAVEQSADDNEPHIALNNIRQRLEMMCNGKLEITPHEEGGTTVKVTIPSEQRQSRKSTSI